MTINRRELYAAGLPLGGCVTRREFGRMVCGGGGGDSTSASQITYPDEIKPLLTNVANLSTQLYNTPFQGYTGQRFAGLNGTQNQALQGTIARAQNGSPVDQAAQSNLTDLMGNQQNPFLDQMVQSAQKSVVDSFNNSTAPQLTNAAVGSGSFGNSGVQQAQQYADSQLQQNLGNVAANMYGNAFNTNQANRLSAIGMAPQIANQDYVNLSQMMNAGNTLQDNAQNPLDFAYQQFQDQQNDPYKKLQAMTGVMQGTAGSTTTTNQGGK